MPAQPNRPLLMSGVHAYAEKSVKAGEIVNFRISSDVPYGLSVCRLGADPDSSALDTVLHNFVPPVAQQPIRPGSYVHVENRLPATSLGAFSVECWVRCFQPQNWSGIVTQYTYPTDCGFALLVGNNQIYCYLGGGGAFNSAQLFAGPMLAPTTTPEWRHVVVTWNGSQGTFFLQGVAQATFSYGGPMNPGAAPLRLGAYGEAGLTDHFFDGDIAMPVVYNRALSPSEVTTRFDAGGLTLPLSGVLGCWPLDEELGATVNDVSGLGRHGAIVNHASWMIGGPNYHPATVPRYGGSASWAGSGHGLRFAADDLYDCGWNAVAGFVVPATAKSGLYVGRIVVAGAVVYQVPFIVKRPDARPKAEILVLAATNTWAAYSNPFPSPGPSFNCYEAHLGSQPTFQIGMKMPMRAAGIYDLYQNPPVGYSHLVRAERFLHQWLDRSDYAYDMVTDLDLHRDPTLLTGYKVLVINGHSEYWSSESFTAVEQFLDSGNGVVSLSGNTMFWRVSFDPTGSVMECRKFDGGQTFGGQIATVGEIWHSHDGKRGGLMRECGFPAWKILGLDTAGFVDVSAAAFLPFSVSQSSHFLFNTPQAVGVSNTDALGQAPGGGLPLAVGHEYDARLIHLLEGTTTPQGAVQPTEPAGITTLAQAVRSNGVLDYWGHWATGWRVCSEIIYWERPAGAGIVFNIGTIGAGWALSKDVQLQKLLHNVMYRLGVTVTPGVPAASVTSQGPTVVVHRSLHGTGQDKRRNGGLWLPSLPGWNGAGPRIVGTPAALAWSTYVSALAVGTEGELLSRYWDGLQWGPPSTWQALGGSTTGALAITSRAQFTYPNAQPSAFDVFALGRNGSIQRKWWDGSSWGPTAGLEDLGGTFIDAPAAINWGSYLTVMGVWTDGTLRNKYRDGYSSSSWPSSWGNLGGLLAGPLAISSRRPFAAADFDIFALARDGAIHRLSWVGGAWSGWVSMGGSFVGGPAAVSWNNGTRITVFAVEGDGELRSRWWDSVGGWSGSWDLLPGVAPIPFLGPVRALDSGSGRIDLFAVGTDRALWTRFWDGSVWQGWSNLGT